MATTQKAAFTALKRSRSALTFRHQMALDEQQRIERAERIKQLREESPYTQAALAERIGVSPRAYQRWEEGGGIEWDHLERLAEIHGVDVMWIHRGVGRGPTPDLLSAPVSRSELDERLEWIERALVALLAERGLDLDAPTSAQGHPQRSDSSGAGSRNG